MKFDLTDKICIVTGGASGMGREISRQIAKASGTAIIADINDKMAAEVAEELRAVGLQADSVRIDGTDIESVKAASDLIVAKYGRIDCLVNCMGIGAGAKEGETYDQTFKRLVDFDLMTIFNSCNVFGEEMIKNGGGLIVNIASQAAQIVPKKNRPGRGGEYGLIGYCTAKAAVRHMTRSMATLWAGYGIRANTISPGYVDTPLTAGPHSDPKIRAEMIATVPLKRIAQPEDIYATVLFLLSDEASYITAQDFVIDGGYTAQ